MNKTTLIALALASAITANDARAQRQEKGISYLSGNELHMLCKNPEDVTQLACLHYILGMNDAFVAAAWPSCVPKSVTGNQIKAIVTKYLDENSEERHHSAASTTWVAIGHAFPCQ